MANDVKIKYGTNGQAITCSMASVADGSARASTAVDNTTNLFLDALVQVTAKTGASGVSATGYINVFAYATSDGGTKYTDGVTGTDAAFTVGAQTNLALLGTIGVAANATSYTSSPMSVAAAFGGVLPDHWGIVIHNNTGAALDATEGNHKKVYQGILTQVV